MRKTSILLSAMLCAGIAQVSTTRVSQAQQAALSFNQILARSNEDFFKKDYAVVEEDARGLLVLARSPQEKSHALRLLGETLYRRKAYDEAIEQWDTLLDLTGTDNDQDIHAVAHLGLARSYNAKESYDKAIPNFEAVVNYFVQRKQGEGVKIVLAIVSLALADTLYNAHQNDLALEKFKQVTASAQDTPPMLVLAYTRIGQINLEQGEYERARIAYGQVLQQVDATKVRFDDVDLRAFATNQIVATRLVENTAYKKQLSGNGNFTYTSAFKRSTKFDQKVSRIISEIIDAGFVKSSLKDKPFSGS